jgi:hypothetical protein
MAFLFGRLVPATNRLHCLGMPETDDPFTGTWKFNAELSQLSTPPPVTWVQQILVTETDIQISEHIERPDGSVIVSSVQAKFDGEDYPVLSSPAVDTIAYTRDSRTAIAGSGKKNGALSLMEAVRVDQETGRLTLHYTVYRGAQPISKGSAVFEKLG